MRFLVGWDDPAQIELISTFLNIGDSSAVACSDAAAFEQAATHERFDAILLALNFPTTQDSFALFRHALQWQRDVPVVGAWYRGELHHLAKFIVARLHSHLQRDEQGEFVLLLTTMLEAAVAAAHSRRAELIAEKLREEVESVRQLQESVIPRRLPIVAGYQLAARYEPSQIRVIGDRPVVMAGGDYYNAFRLSPDHISLILGDAAGHGVRACMSIMTMHTLITMIQDRRFPTTSEFVGEVNRRLARDSIVAGEQGGFITLLFGHLDTKQHRLQWTSAGHPVPLLHCLDTNEVTAVGNNDDTGLALAITDDWEYVLSEVAIPPRCRLLLYTDGLDEAYGEVDGRHIPFGLAGIKQTLQASAQRTVEETVDALFQASHEITRGEGRLDDTTVFLLERQS
jgi:serine phosphatase RsbU (regulator of sigma subunit)